mmetsp:Transcript_23734/g.47155  ORF Transcript_23734/g.47155 Transcript_23734/m.47155 type:complete len:121 (-) Transcript_23734:105-467(-)
MNIMATTLSAHMDNRPNIILIDSSTDDDSSEMTSPSTARLQTIEGGEGHMYEATENQWEEDCYGEKKEWVTISLLDDDDTTDNFLGNDYKYNNEGCATHTVETCVFVSKPVLHFLHFFMC